GKSKPIRTAMMAMTTNSSIRVKPARRFDWFMNPPRETNHNGEPGAGDQARMRFENGVNCIRSLPRLQGKTAVICIAGLGRVRCVSQNWLSLLARRVRFAL